MSRSKRLITGALLLGVALVVVLLRHTPERPRAELRPAEPHSHELAPPALEAPAPPPGPSASPAPGEANAAAMAQAQKQALARDAEAGRIAARENKLAALDWEAPRPGPPPADQRVPVSKREAELTVEEKVDKTERIAAQLRERIRRTQQAVDAAAKTGQQDGTEVMLLARLQARASELEQNAQSLRGQRREQEPKATGRESTVSPEVTQ